MYHLRQYARINLYDFYRIMEYQYPTVAKKYRQDLSEMPINARNIDDWIYKINDNLYIREEDRKKLGAILEMIKANKHPLIECRKRKRKIFSLTEQGLEFVGKDKVISYMISRGDSSPNLRNKMMSSSLCDFLHSHSPNNMFRSVIEYMSMISVEEKQDKNFTIRKDGKMTYLPSNKECIITDSGNWDPSPRQEIKYGKGIKKMMQGWYDISAKEVESINNDLAAKFTFSARFEVVTGSDITKYYHYSEYAPNTGPLRDSCMRHDSCQDFFEIYENNCKMLVAFNRDEKIVGRALLWDTVAMENGEVIKFMDRIYGVDITVEAFKGWAKENGYYHKRYQNYSDTRQIVSPEGQEMSELLEITIGGGTYGYLPYFDTFKWCDRPDEIEFTINNEDGAYEMTSTEGDNPIDGEDTILLHNGRRVHEDDAFYVESEGEYYDVDEVRYVEGTGQHHLCEHVVLDVDNDYILREEAVFIESNAEWYHQDDERITYCDETRQSELVDDVIYVDDLGETYLIESIARCEITEEHVVKEDAKVVTHNGLNRYFSPDIDELEIQKFIQDEN